MSSDNEEIEKFKIITNLDTQETLKIPTKTIKEKR